MLLLLTAIFVATLAVLLAIVINPAVNTDVTGLLMRLRAPWFTTAVYDVSLYI